MPLAHQILSSNVDTGYLLALIFVRKTVEAYKIMLVQVSQMVIALDKTYN